MVVPLVPLGSIASILVGMPTRHLDVGQGRQAAGPLRAITVRALTGNGIQANLLTEVVPLAQPAERYCARRGDVLVPSRSTSLKPAVVQADLDGTIFNATLIAIRCLPKLHPALLVAWLLAPAGQEALAAVTQSGTAQMNVTAAGLAQLPVPVPPIEEQPRLAAAIEAAEEAYRTASQAAEQRRRIARRIVVDAMRGSCHDASQQEIAQDE